MEVNDKLMAIYVRKSRLKNDDAMEISRQIELLTDYASKNGMQYNIFHEEGSSEDWNRAELQRMLNELKSGIYDGVLVTEQDRISRDSTDFGLFKRFCIEEGLMFYTLNKAYDFSNDDDNFMTGITAEMDNHFMRVLKRKMLRGRIQALESGVFFGVAPYGYTKSQTKPKRLIKHPEQFKVVESIFNMYVNKKYNQQEIANQLNLLGHKTNENNPFTSRSISLILSNVVYTGTVYYSLRGREPIVVEDAHESIIDKLTYNQAQVIRGRKRIVPQKSKMGVYALSRLLVCPKCKTTLSFCMKYNYHRSNGELDKGRRELFILNCRASMSSQRKAENNTRCTNMGVKASRVEEKIFQELSKYIDELNHEIDLLLKEGDSLFGEVKYQIEGVNKRLSQLAVERKRVQEGFAAGIYDIEEAQEKIKSLDDAKLKLEINLEDLNSTDSTSEIEKKEKYKQIAIDILSGDMEEAELNRLLREIIECIYYYKEKADNKKQHPFFIEIVYKS